MSCSCSLYILSMSGRHIQTLRYPSSEVCWFPVYKSIAQITVSPECNQRWSGNTLLNRNKKVREKSRECHNHKPQPFPDTKRKRKQTKPNNRKSNKRTKSTKISSLFPKRGNRNAKRTEKHKNTITQVKT